MPAKVWITLHNFEGATTLVQQEISQAKFKKILAVINSKVEANGS